MLELSTCFVFQLIALDNVNLCAPKSLGSPPQDRYHPFDETFQQKFAQSAMRDQMVVDMQNRYQVNEKAMRLPIEGASGSKSSKQLTEPVLL